MPFHARNTLGIACLSYDLNEMQLLSYLEFRRVLSVCQKTCKCSSLYCYNMLQPVISSYIFPATELYCTHKKYQVSASLVLSVIT